VDENGEKILTTTVVTCARVGAGEPCFLFSSSAVPDDWQKYDCQSLPEDCGVSASAHPAYP
jgi:hypothetical protein